MKYLSFLIMLAVCFTCFGANGFEMSVSSASYRGQEEGLSYTEIYLSYARHHMTFSEYTDGSFSGSAKIQFVLLDAEGNVVDDSAFERNFSIHAGSDPKIPYHMIDLFPELLAPGKYKANIQIVDNNAENSSDEIAFEIIIPDYHTGLPMLSDIFLIGMIDEPDSSIFTRYGLKLLPYPRAVFTPTFPLMQYSHEVYDYETTCKLNIFVRDAQGTKVREFQKRDIPEGGIVISQINVAGLPDGDYTLNLQLIDKYDKITDKRKHGFTVIKNESNIPDSLIVNEAELISKMMTYLLTNVEKNRFDNLESNGKIEYWKRFWQEDHEINREDFIANWSYVVRAFETGPRKADGYKTDMGKVYLKIGPPDFIERNPFSTQSNQWEKWSYSSSDPKGYIIFGDEKNIGDMKILHSTIMGYKFDENWMKKLSRDEDGMSF